MSRIFRAIERTWESRHSRPLLEVREEAPEIQTVSGILPPKNGTKVATAERPEIKSEPAGLSPLLGSARIRLAHGSPLLPFDGSDHRSAEQYKIVRTKILHHFSKPRSIAVSSAQIDDGKSVSAVNIAGCLALKDQTTVLLVDADLRRSTLAQALGVPALPGLADVLAGRCPLERAIVRLEPFPNLYFLPNGEKPDNPAELLDSGRWRALSASLRKEFGFVVIDAPPIGLVADYDMVQDVSDGVVLVVRPDHTNRTLCLKAIESVPPEKLIGVVINYVKEWFLMKPLGQRYDYYYEKT